MKRSLGISILMFVVAAISLCAGLCSAEELSPVPQIPVNGKITMVYFEQNRCFGCWMQASAFKAVEEKYRNSDQVAIVNINLSTHASQAAKYQIKETPAQIFYDTEGKEVYRHTGMMFKGSIISRLTKMGAKQ